MRYLICSVALIVTVMASAEPARHNDDEGPLRYPYSAKVRQSVDDSAAARSWQNIQLSTNYADPCNYYWGCAYSCGYYGNYSYVGYGPVWGYRPLGHGRLGRGYYGWR